MGASGLGAVSFPIMALVLAIIFSPLGTGVTQQCSLTSTSSCAIGFNSQATIVLSSSGYSLYQTGYQTCQQITSVASVPILGWLSKLPILSNIFDAFATFGAFVAYFAGGGGSGAQAVGTTCQQQLGNIMVFNYTGHDFILQLIGVVVSAGAISAIAGLSVLGSGENSAGTYLLFMLSSLSLLWLVLSAFAYPTFIQMPTLIGTTIYTFLTLIYAFGMIDIIS
jgi:hypothetical protein